MIPVLSIAMTVLTPLVIAFAMQRFVVLPRSRRELEILNARRAERVAEALGLASTPLWNPPPEVCYPFSGWIELLRDGSIQVGGQQFKLTESFEVIARDSNRIQRATLSSNGSGEGIIQSHGQTFAISFHDTCWQVQSLPNNDAIA